MLVREFETADRQVFIELCKKFYETGVALRGYDEKITEKTFSRIMDRHENLWGYLLVAADTKNNIGYAIITSYWSNEEGGDVIVLDELFIDVTERKKGYAKLFLQWLEENFKSASAITLEVLTSNHSACELYSKAGYTPDGYTTYTKSIRGSD